ncbi:MAG: ketol-acid reductoisomerase [Candidatus Melainabacteria bacterium]|nr:ketol-acid reductoisomerase [Candidatus Melainabacteria bacterium]
MATIHFDSDAELEYLKGLTVGIIGYGNQGRAQALNLRDSGVDVRVGAREGGPSESLALADGMETYEIGRVVSSSQILVLTLPDEQMVSVYRNAIEPFLTADKTFIFAHGFAVHHRLLRLPQEADIILVAPTGPGHQLRTLYLEGRGLPALIAVEQDFSGYAHKRCLAYARAIGSTRAGAIETTFAEETVTDLFCEQAVLCGGLPELIKASFETLVTKGYQPELAYISCLKEVKLIADLLFSRGLPGMRQAISTTAAYGAALSGPEIIDGRAREKLTQILTRIEDGSFAASFIHDLAAGDSRQTGILGEQLRAEKHSRLARTGTYLSSSIHF